MKLIEYCRHCEYFIQDYSQPAITYINDWFDCTKFRSTHCDHAHFIEAMIGMPGLEYSTKYKDLIECYKKNCPKYNKILTFFKLKYI